MNVAIVGGTGDEGFGLAVRLAAAGVSVTIGSRAEERAHEAARRARQASGTAAPVDGAENPAAVAAADLTFVTVPYGGQADIYRSLRDHWRPGSVVCDTTSPLATAVGGRAWQVLRPWHGSAAEQAAALLPDGVRLVAGFHTVSAEPLTDVGEPLDADILLCGDDDGAKVEVGAMVDHIPGARWVDCGALSMARVLEPITAALVSVNRKYGIRGSGVRLTGREAWGPPAR
ncbi:MAG TPA: NADPH-dependent F420 reductase [Actinomycetota bacterium]|jgi:NADPH-dependent F420 reductase|nr:NADPH-dependent F420 reductase [Actinomycetota bacterium]